VRLGDVPDDREAHAEAAVLARRRRVRLPEALEEVRRELRRDPLAGVLHADHRLLAVPVEPDLDAPAWRRELHRVREEVPEDLLEPARIALHRPCPRHERRGDLDVARRRRGTDRRDGGLDHRDEIDRANVQPELPLHDS